MATATADPTIDFLRRLDDPSKWVVRRNVPIFKPHKRIKKGEEVYRITEKDLPGIVRNIQRLEKEQGIVMRITDAHTKQVPTRSESEDQPNLFGFARNARIDYFGPDKEVGIVADEYYFPEYGEAASRLPFRSAEYYPQSKSIRGVAMLLQDPYLDLGMVAYSLSSEEPQLYSLGESDMPMETMGANSVMPEPEGGKEHDLSEPEMKHCDRYVKYMKCQMKKAGGMEKYFAADEPDTNLPSEGHPAEKHKMPGEKAEEYARDELRVNYSRLEQRFAAIEKQNADLVRERDRAKCEQMVTQLVAEQYQLNRSEEIEELMGRDEAGRKKYCDRIRANYNKGPMGEMVQIYQGNMEPGSATVNDAQETREDYAHGVRAEKLMRANPGMQYGEAKERTKTA